MILKIHTAEFQYSLTQSEYINIIKYFYTQGKRCYEKRGIIYYSGMVDNGIRIEMHSFKSKNTLIPIYTLKYIIAFSRYINENDYLELTDINKLFDILCDINDYIALKSPMLPKPLDCKIGRIDLTHDVPVGENVQYIIKLFNRCYTPTRYNQLYATKQDNATYTKMNKIGTQKIFELSFYDKQKEMENHMTNNKYCYNEETLKKAEGILRIEFRLYNTRLNGMRKTYNCKTIQEFLNMLSFEAEKIILKNLRSLYLLGNFYKLNEIINKIDASYFKEKTKKLMREFIELSSSHKNADIAAIEFEDKYGEKILKNILQKFNKLGIIPVPISVRQNFDEWGFMD